MPELTRETILEMEAGPELDALVERLSSTWKLEWETDKNGNDWLNATFPRDHGASSPLLKRRIMITKAKDGQDDDD